MLNILSAHDSVKSFDEHIAENVTIFCNIHCIHPFWSRYKMWCSPSSCRTSLELSSAFFECSSFSTKCTVLLVHLNSTCFKLILKSWRLTSVSTGRVYHSSYVILAALFTPCPGRDPYRGSFLFCHSEVRSLSSVGSNCFLLSPDAIPEFERLHCIVAVSSWRVVGASLLKKGLLVAQPSSLMALFPVACCHWIGVGQTESWREWIKKCSAAFAALSDIL